MKSYKNYFAEIITFSLLISFILSNLLKIKLYSKNFALNLEK